MQFLELLEDGLLAVSDNEAVGVAYALASCVVEDSLAIVFNLNVFDTSDATLTDAEGLSVLHATTTNDVDVSITTLNASGKRLALEDERAVARLLTGLIGNTDTEPLGKTHDVIVGTYRIAVLIVREEGSSGHNGDIAHGLFAVNGTMVRTAGLAVLAEIERSVVVVHGLYAIEEAVGEHQGGNDAAILATEVVVSLGTIGSDGLKARRTAGLRQIGIFDLDDAELYVNAFLVVAFNLHSIRIVNSEGVSHDIAELILSLLVEGDIAIQEINAKTES